MVERGGPAPAQRTRAGFVYAVQRSVPLTQRLARLTALLDHDSDDVVCEQVADGLQWMLHDARSGDPEETSGPDPEVAGELVDCLRRHRRDSSPAVRAIVFAALASTDGEPDLDWLLRELADPDVHAGFVSAVAPRTAGQYAFATKGMAIAAALQRLHDHGWAERVADGDFPGPVERRQALDTAIAAWVED